MYDWAEFRHFRYLLAILEKRGFRAAAEELHTSQPNLTVQARQFQENAGVRLFQKSKTGHIRPTETGAAFKVLSRYLLEVRDEVIDALIEIERGNIASICCGWSSMVDQELFRSLCSLHKSLLPAAAIQPTHGDVPQLIEDIQAGTVDLALVTLPVKHPELHVEELRRDRLVACVRRDSDLARKSTVNIEDLQRHLRVFYHPKRHPEAHTRLLELLSMEGVRIGEHSSASHPFEMQALVREGFGAALIREGTSVDDQLTTRPIVGVDWTIDTALIYHKQRFPKTVPVFVRMFRKKFGQESQIANIGSVTPISSDGVTGNKSRVPADPKDPVQLSLLG